MTRRLLIPFVVLIALAVLCPSAGFAAPTGAAALGDATYIEFILDASISMTARIGRDTRLSIAKSVMEQLIRDLPDDPSLHVALRIYGAELDPSLTACDDSVLVQPFAPVKQAKANMIKQVQAMQARGMTPIARSLELAAADFPKAEGARKIVILMTDGEESCGGDPCAVSARLQKQGIFLRPYVVGFALNDKQKKLVECIGEFYEATDTASLMKALGTVVEQAIQPSTIEVQAVAGSLDVTDRAEISIRRPSGEVVATSLTATVPARVRAVVDEGDFVISAVMKWGSQTLRANDVMVSAVPGKVVPVRLDFGSLDGRVILKATASGMDVTADVDVQVRRDNGTVNAMWAGMPLTSILQAGDYTLTVTHRKYPNLKATVPVRVVPGTNTPVTVDLGQLPAALEVRVMFMGRSVVGFCQASAQGSAGSIRLALSQSADSLQMSATPGTYEVRVVYSNVVSVEKTIQGVELRGGETTRIVVNLDDLLGVLKVRVKAGPIDATSEAEVTASSSGSRFVLPYAGGVREAIVTPGGYMATARYRGIFSDTAEAYVQAGRTTEIEIEIQMPGKIVLYPTLSGKPMAPSKVNASAFQSGAPAGQFKQIADVLELSCEPGIYSVVARINDPYEQSITIDNIAVKSGETVSIRADFKAATLLRVNLISEGKPFDLADVAVYFNGSDDWNWMDRVSRGVWEMKLPEGKHDVVVIPKVDGMAQKRIPSIEVVGGSTTEKVITMGGTGLLRVKLMSDGKPFDLADVSVYFDGSDDWNWMDRVSRGVWEMKLPEGKHDVVVIPKVDGMAQKRIPSIEIVGGSTTEQVITMGGTGLLRVKLMNKGRVFDDADVAVYFDGSDEEWSWMDRVGRGVWEMRLPEGKHDVVVIPEVDGVIKQRVRGVEVAGGSTVEKTVDLSALALVRVLLTAGGKPTSDAGLELLDASDDWIGDLTPVSKGTFEIRVVPGEYRVYALPHLDGYEEKWSDWIEISDVSEVIELRLELPEG